MHCTSSARSRVQGSPPPRGRLIALLVGSLLCTPCLADDYSEILIADAHLHLLDFLQNGDHLENGRIVPKRPGAALPAGQRGKRIEALFWAMDRANVSHALVSGMPFLKKWSEDESFRPGYYLDSSSRVVRARDTDYHLALAIEDYRKDKGADGEKQLARIHACVSGFDATDLGAVDMIAKRMKEFPGLFRCIGEVMSRHDDLTNLTTGERPRGNHPALMRIYDFAGEHDIPVSVHHNIAPVSVNGIPKGPLYLPELLDAFEASPKTTFIWCHAGISRRILVADLPGILEDVMERHGDHVNVDLSWVVYPDYILNDVAAWASLIRRYPNNFLIGSDAVGRLADYPEQIRIYGSLFEAIGNREVIEKLASGNFLRIMRKEGVTLPAGYHYPETRLIQHPHVRP